jgi:hypothetical protein
MEAPIRQRPNLIAQTSQRNIFCQVDYRGLSCDLIKIYGYSSELKCLPQDCSGVRFFYLRKEKHSHFLALTAWLFYEEYDARWDKT